MPQLAVAATEFDLPTSRHAEAIVRAIESASAVRRRSQFFVWSQNQLQTLLPHQLAVCGAYQRMRKDLVFEVFNSVPVPASLLTLLVDPTSPLMRRLIARWIESRGQPVVIDLLDVQAGSDTALCKELIAGGYRHLLVHGLARPQRPSELESLFVLASAGTGWSGQQCLFFGMLLPHVHATYQRATLNEREFGLTPTGPARPGKPVARCLITDRELQILSWVREGMSNLQIGIQLDISSLTVKNHVQKILRKLGAANRAQAVAMAIRLNLMGAADGDTHE